MDSDAGADQEVNRVMRDYRIGETLGRLTVACVVVVGMSLGFVALAILAGVLAGWAYRCFMAGWAFTT